MNELCKSYTNGHILYKLNHSAKKQHTSLLPPRRSSSRTKSQDSSLSLHPLTQTFLSSKGTVLLWDPWERNILILWRVMLVLAMIFNPLQDF